MNLEILINFVNVKYHFKLLQINQLNITILIYTIKVIIVSSLFNVFFMNRWLTSKNGFMSPYFCAVTVSYTHLDVYKRQV